MLDDIDAEKAAVQRAVAGAVQTDSEKVPESVIALAVAVEVRRC